MTIISADNNMTTVHPQDAESVVKETSSNGNDHSDTMSKSSTILPQIQRVPTSVTTITSTAAPSSQTQKPIVQYLHIPPAVLCPIQASLFVHSKELPPYLSVTVDDSTRFVSLNEPIVKSTKTYYMDEIVHADSNVSSSIIDTKMIARNVMSGFSEIVFSFGLGNVFNESRCELFHKCLGDVESLLDPESGTKIDYAHVGFTDMKCINLLDESRICPETLLNDRPDHFKFYGSQDLHEIKALVHKSYALPRAMIIRFEQRHPKAFVSTLTLIDLGNNAFRLLKKSLEEMNAILYRVGTTGNTYELPILQFPFLTLCKDVFGGNARIMSAFHMNFSGAAVDGDHILLMLEFMKHLRGVNTRVTPRLIDPRLPFLEKRVLDLVSAHQSLLKESRAQKARHTKELSDAKDALTQLRQEMAQALKEKDERMNRKTSESEQDRNILSAELSSAKLTISSQSEELRVAQTAIATTKQELKELENVNSQLQDIHDGLISDLTTHQSELESATQKISLLESAMNALQSERDGLRDSIKLLEEQLEQSQSQHASQISTLTKQLTEKTHENTLLAEENQRNATSIVKRDDQNKSLAETISCLESQNAELKKQLDERESQIESLKSNLEIKETQISQSDTLTKKQLADWEANKQQLEMEISREKTTRETLEKKTMSLQSQVDLLKDSESNWKRAYDRMVDLFETQSKESKAQTLELLKSQYQQLREEQSRSESLLKSSLQIHTSPLEFKEVNPPLVPNPTPNNQATASITPMTVESLPKEEESQPIPIPTQSKTNSDQKKKQARGATKSKRKLDDRVEKEAQASHQKEEKQEFVDDVTESNSIAQPVIGTSQDREEPAQVSTTLSVDSNAIETETVISPESASAAPSDESRISKKSSKRKAADVSHDIEPDVQEEPAKAKKTATKKTKKSGKSTTQDAPETLPSLSRTSDVTTVSNPLGKSRANSKRSLAPSSRSVDAEDAENMVPNRISSSSTTSFGISGLSKLWKSNPVSQGHNDKKSESKSFPAMSFQPQLPKSYLDQRRAKKLLDD